MLSNVRVYITILPIYCMFPSIQLLRFQAFLRRNPRWLQTKRRGRRRRAGRRASTSKARAGRRGRGRRCGSTQQPATRLSGSAGNDIEPYSRRRRDVLDDDEASLELESPIDIQDHHTPSFPPSIQLKRAKYRSNPPFQIKSKNNGEQHKTNLSFKRPPSLLTTACSAASLSTNNERPWSEREWERKRKRKRPRARARATSPNARPAQRVGVVHDGSGGGRRLLQLRLQAPRTLPGLGQQHSPVKGGD